MFEADHPRTIDLDVDPFRAAGWDLRGQVDVGIVHYMVGAITEILPTIDAHHQGADRPGQERHDLLSIDIDRIISEPGM